MYDTVYRPKTPLKPLHLFNDKAYIIMIIIWGWWGEGDLKFYLQLSQQLEVSFTNYVCTNFWGKYRIFFRG